MFDAVQFGARLRQARHNNGLTTSQASESIFVSQGTISRYENALVFPSIDRLYELARLYGCSVDWLFGIDGGNADE